MAKAESELLEAAAQFDTELAAYTRLGELFVKTPLSSVKHLERANATLAEIASSEERLQAAGGRLVAALATARDRQEALAASVVAHVPTLQERNRRLQELMSELAGVANEVAGLNTSIVQRGADGEITSGPTAADARDVSASVLALSERAHALAESARGAEFEELATQAHALHQKLLVIGKKLAVAGGAPN